MATTAVDGTTAVDNDATAVTVPQSTSEVEQNDGTATSSLTYNVPATTHDYTVNLANVNDNSPVFEDGDSSTVNVAENDATATVGTFTATDADGDALYYVLQVDGFSDVEDSPFAINVDTGEVTLTKALDFETQGTYTLTITVRHDDPRTQTVEAAASGGPKGDTAITAEHRLTVNVQSVNEAPSSVARVA